MPHAGSPARSPTRSFGGDDDAESWDFDTTALATATPDPPQEGARPPQAGQPWREPQMQMQIQPPQHGAQHDGGSRGGEGEAEVDGEYDSGSLVTLSHQGSTSSLRSAAGFGFEGGSDAGTPRGSVATEDLVGSSRPGSAFASPMVSPLPGRDDLAQKAAVAEGLTPGGRSLASLFGGSELESPLTGGQGLESFFSSQSPATALSSRVGAETDEPVFRPWGGFSSAARDEAVEGVRGFSLDVSADGLSPSQPAGGVGGGEGVADSATRPHAARTQPSDAGTAWVLGIVLAVAMIDSFGYLVGEIFWQDQAHPQY